MVFIKSQSSKYLWLLLALFLLFLAFFLNVFLGLDQREKPEQADVIIAAEGLPDRVYQGVELLLDGYATSDQLIVSPAKEENLSYYFDAGQKESS